MTSMKWVALLGVLALGLGGCGNVVPAMQTPQGASESYSAKRVRSVEGMVTKVTRDSLTIGVFGPGPAQTFTINAQTVFSYRQTAQVAPRFSDLKLDDVVEIGFRDHQPDVAITVMVSMNGYRR